MKWLVTPLLGVIFVALIACSIQSISADHESGKGIFKDRSEVNLVTTQDSDYQVYLQAVLRNGDGQLINVTENTKTAAYIPHEISDYVFDTLMGEKEIITIDNIKYEKSTYSAKPPMEKLISEYNRPRHFNGNWQFNLCADFVGHDYVCIPIFHTNTALLPLEISDVVTTHWTVLRVMN